MAKKNNFKHQKIMKKASHKIKSVILILVVLIPFSGLWAQSPEKISYQAVVRDSNNLLVINTEIGMRVSILQGSASGSAIYTETHTPTTNGNGLISIEIGDGSTNDNFADINWAEGTYFIKTEIAPDGSTNYSITGTSQVLSVPYALHAKTADALTEEIIESDPVFSESPAANITNQHITNINNLSGVNTGDQDLSLLATQAALGDSISLLRSEIKKYAIGDYAQGGVVFWVDETGQHGLVCAIEELYPTTWYAGTNGSTHAIGDGVYAGKDNTTLIIAAHLSIGDNGNMYAARLCFDYLFNQNDIVYGDWFLPSKHESTLMIQKKEIINQVAIAHGGDAFLDEFYWTSVEYSGNNTMAWVINAVDGSLSYAYKNNNVGRSRPIRAF